MDTPSERLKYFVEQRFTTIREFCKIIGLHENSFNKYAGDGERSIFGKKYQAKLSHLGLNLSWYVYGIGEMLTKDVIFESNVSEINTSKIRYIPDFSHMTVNEIQEYYSVNKPLVDKAEKILEVMNAEN